MKLSKRRLLLGIVWFVFPLSHSYLYARTTSPSLFGKDQGGVHEKFQYEHFQNQFHQRVLNDAHTRNVIALFRSGKIELSKAYETLRFKIDASSDRK